MNASWSIALHHPAALVLLPLCCAAFLLLRRVRPRAAFAEPGLLPWLLRPARDRDRWLLAAAWLLIAIAVSGPHLQARGTAPPRAALDVALVMDISPSMSADDLAPDRLQRARLEAYDLLQRLAGNRVALIAYSGYAYRVLPLSYDLPLVHGYIEALDTGLTRHQGSNLVQALEFAAQALTASAEGGRAIVLLSDGESTDAAAVMATAERFAQRSIPVFALGVGTAAGAPVPAAGGHMRRTDGAPVVSRLDRTLLAALAARSGGRYADLSADDADLAQLLAGITALEPRQPGGRAIPAGYPLHPWLLAAGLILLLAGSRRYRPASSSAASLPALALVLVAALCTTTPGAAFASGWQERAAHRALQQGDYGQAATLYENIGGYTGKMGAGAAAYRRGDWAAARTLYRAAAEFAGDDTARALAHYNEANALARLGLLPQAVRRLDEALALHPNHARAALNRDLLQRALQRSERAQDEAMLPRIGDSGAGSGAGESTAATAASVDRDGNESGAADSPGDADASRHAGMAVLSADAAENASRAMPLRTAGDSVSLPAGALRDDPREVLRHRFMVMDAGRIRMPEQQTW